MAIIEKGQFVRVGNSIGVIVTLDLENEHVGVWYGELADSETPKYRIVPVEYCELISKVEYYH